MDAGGRRQSRRAFPFLALGLLAAALIVAFALPRPQAPARPPVASCSGTFAVATGSATLSLPYCSNRSITTHDDGIRRLVVVIHGDARNANEYLDSVQAAADAAGATGVLIVAPQFRTVDDDATEGAPNGLYYSDNGWKEGAASETAPFARPGSVSSFAAVDALVHAILTGGAFPNLRMVVITGHSAGGQFVDRYLAASPLEDELEGSVRFRYVIANPSSYLYLDERRPDESSAAFRALSARALAECPGFDSWKYGLEGLNAYAAIAGRTMIRARYAERDVVYLLGAEDTDPNDPSLDTSCAAELQGRDRLDRGQQHFAYLGTMFGDSVYGSHVLTVVDGVSHDGRAMYLSDAARAALFQDPGQG